MFNHISVGTNDLEAAGRFYDATLGALGYRRTLSEDSGLAWGLRWPEFWATQTFDRRPASVGNGTHVAFIAPSRQAVEDFHAAALANGGSDDGKPGERSYHPGYYAAFVRDPEGNKLEAVFLPEVPFPEE